MKLKDVKPILQELRDMAKEMEGRVVAQAAIRSIATACAVVTTPTNALGFTFYALAARIYHEFGLTCNASFYDEKASEYYKDILKSLENITIKDEENPVKIDWNC